MARQSKKEVRKEFRVFLSKQFSDKTILGLKFGTELGEDGADPVELFSKVFASTMADIKRKVTEEKDPFVTSVWKTLVKDIKLEKKAEEAAKSLKDD